MEIASMGAWLARLTSIVTPGAPKGPIPIAASKAKGGWALVTVTNATLGRLSPVRSWGALRKVLYFGDLTENGQFKASQTSTTKVT
jgi:hypothetical protein